MTIQPNPLIPTGAVTIVNRIKSRMRTDTCSIQRKSGGVDAGGAPISENYATVASIDCRVQAPGRIPTEIISGGRVGPSVDYEIYLPPTTDVRSDDRIEVNGRTMEVVADQDAVSYGFELRVLVTATLA